MTSPRLPISGHYSRAARRLWFTVLALLTSFTSAFAEPQISASDTALTLAEEVIFSSPPGLFRDTLTLTLSGQNLGQKIRYVLSPPSDTGATVSAPTSTSTEYIEPIILSSSHIVRAAIFSSDDTQSGPATSAQYVKFSTSGSNGLDNFSSQLPVMVIDSHGLGDMVKDDIDRAGWVYGFSPDANGSATLTGTTSFAIPVAFAVRGNSSALFPKQSFKMKFRNATGGKQTLAPFGLPAFEKWHLIGMWHFDQSHIRNSYIYELSNRIGLWAPRTHFVEVFVNRNDDGLDAQDYAGIYAITDKIEPNPLRVNVASLSKSANTAPDITGGYIMKFDWYDHGDYVFTTKLGRALIMDTPDAEDITTEQGNYIQGYVQSMEDALVADSASNWASRTYLDYINRDSWIDFHILNTLAKNNDAFIASSLLNKDRNGKLNAGPLWDFDRSMGSNDGRVTQWDGWRTQDDGDGWNSPWWGRLVRDPDFMQGWIDRWQTLRLTTFSDQTLTSLADDLSNQIGTAAANRDSARFPENTSRHPGGYIGEINHLKTWMRERAKWIDQQFLLPPTVTTEGNNITLTPAPGAQIVYTTNASDPRRSGGQTTAGVLTSNAPVVLASSTPFLARSYRTGISFPATPWSRAVSINDATTSAPPAFTTTLKNAVVASDNSVSFSAEGTPGSIQWQVSTDGGSTWANISDNDVYRGTSSTTLTITRAGTALDGNQFRFIATHNGAASTSNAATLTVKLTVFRAPTGIAAGSSGELYVADSTNDSIHKITEAGLVSPFANATSNPRFSRPGGMARLPDGSLIVADSANATIKHINPDGRITILAGQTGVRGSADGTGTAAIFSSPADVAADANGNLFIADATNHTIRKITPSGVVSTYAGTAGTSGSIDANGPEARFNMPGALTVDRNGVIYVADSINHTIRQISPTGEATTFAGLPGVAGYDDGTGIHALFNRPGGMAADSAGNLYVADTGNSTIRKITPAGVVTTIAGTPGIAGIENGIGSLALFNQPKYLTLDSAGNLLVSDTGNALIRRITPDGTVSILSLSLAPPPPAPDPDGGGTTPPPNPGNGGNPSPGSGGSNGGGGGGGASGLGFACSLALLLLLRFWPKSWRLEC